MLAATITDATSASHRPVPLAASFPPTQSNVLACPLQYSNLGDLLPSMSGARGYFPRSGVRRNGRKRKPHRLGTSVLRTHAGQPTVNAPLRAQHASGET